MSRKSFLITKAGALAFLIRGSIKTTLILQLPRKLGVFIKCVFIPVSNKKPLRDENSTEAKDSLCILV
ncbi:MAG: hypothetical protein A2W62_00205 [Alphaproteobacteria bacterium RIFCSPLOWO2_02_42_7]|nr:MAG: hypothetical protein A2W62_00205 [Alphaproteobacteria bacterium RIFCSPLOWO2_02_42_7]